jgi:hypothetical protein
MIVGYVFSVEPESSGQENYGKPVDIEALSVHKPQPIIRAISKAGHNCRITGWWTTTDFPSFPDWDQ